MKRVTERCCNGFIAKPYGFTEQQVLNRLAEYEDAEEQGLLVRLPCKVEDMVYCIRRNPYARGYYVKENKVLSIEWDGRYFTLFTTKEDVLGKTVFLTREEAEKVLKGE